MSTPAAQVARTYVAPGTVWDVARNRDHTTGAGALIPQDLGATTDRPGVWLQWVMLAGSPVAHGEVADEAAMLALHTFAMDSADNPSPRYVAPGDSCTRTDDPGWRWHCLCGHGLTLADWERRPLAGALTGLAVDGHTHTLASLPEVVAALAGKQATLDNATALARIEAVEGGPLLWDGVVVSGGGSGGGTSAALHHTTTSVPNGVSTAIAWATDWDSSGDHWSSAEPTRLTFAASGRVSLSLAIPWPANGSGYRYVWLKKNGSGSAGVAASMLPVSADITTCILAVPLVVSAGDYLQVMSYQSSGSTLSIGGSSGERATVLIQHL